MMQGDMAQIDEMAQSWNADLTEEALLSVLLTRDDSNVIVNNLKDVLERKASLPQEKKEADTRRQSKHGIKARLIRGLSRRNTNSREEILPEGDRVIEPARGSSDSSNRETQHGIAFQGEGGHVRKAPLKDDHVDKNKHRLQHQEPVEEREQGSILDGSHSRLMETSKQVILLEDELTEARLVNKALQERVESLTNELKQEKEAHAVTVLNLTDLDRMRESLEKKLALARLEEQLQVQYQQATAAAGRDGNDDGRQKTAGTVVGLGGKPRVPEVQGSGSILQTGLEQLQQEVERLQEDNQVLEISLMGKAAFSNALQEMIDSLELQLARKRSRKGDEGNFPRQGPSLHVKVKEEIKPFLPGPLSFWSEPAFILEVKASEQHIWKIERTATQFRTLQSDLLANHPASVSDLGERFSMLPVDKNAMIKEENVVNWLKCLFSQQELMTSREVLRFLCI